MGGGGFVARKMVWMPVLTSRTSGTGCYPWFLGYPPDDPAVSVIFLLFSSLHPRLDVPRCNPFISG